MREQSQAVGSQAQWEDRNAPVRLAVIAYLARHPSAADSLAGICGWWLPALGVEAGPDVVEPVLEALVAGRKLERITGVDGTVIYRAATVASEG